MTEASLTDDPGAPGGNSPCFASSGSSIIDCRATKINFHFRLPLITAVTTTRRTVPLTSRFKNCASGFHLFCTKCLHTSIVFTPTVVDTLPLPVIEVVATAFLRSRPTVGFLALEAPRIEIPSMGACARAARSNATYPWQMRVQGAAVGVNGRQG